MTGLKRYAPLVSVLVLVAGAIARALGYADAAHGLDALAAVLGVPASGGDALATVEDLAAVGALVGVAVKVWHLTKEGKGPFARTWQFLKRLSVEVRAAARR
jgi:hypothetical protein